MVLYQVVKEKRKKKKTKKGLEYKLGIALLLCL